MRRSVLRDSPLWREELRGSAPYLNWESWVGPAPFRAFNAELSPPVEKDVYPNWRLYKEYGGGMVSDWGAHMFDIAQWALDNGTTYKMIKLLNPWLRSKSLTVSGGKSYQIKLPNK